MGLFRKKRKEIKIEVCSDLDNKIKDTLHELLKLDLLNTEERKEIELWISKKKSLNRIPKFIQSRWVKEIELYPLQIRFEFIKTMQKRLEYSCSDLVG